MKAIATIDPRLLQMVGRKLYSQNPAVIAVRELLQNSRDACVRKGVEPDIRIIVRHNTKVSPSTVTVTCIDNGIGMTQSQLVNDFLRLGSKKTFQGSQVGGFGIAKAAILSGEDWKIRTLDNILNKELLLSGGEIQKCSSTLHGTAITISIILDTHRFRHQFGHASTRYLTAMIYTSDVSIKFRWYDDGVLTFKDDHAGAKQLIKTGDRQVIDHCDKYTCSLALFQKFSSKLSVGQFTGMNFIRLHGLTQFIHGSLWGNDQRLACLIFDIDPRGTNPEDSDYPFTMSREGLIGSTRKVVDELIEVHDTEVLQSDRMVQVQSSDAPTAIIPGELLTGTRSSVYAGTAKPARNLGNAANLSNASKHSAESEQSSSANMSDGELPKLLISNYVSENPEWDAKLLQAWGAVLKLVTHHSESFGLGLTGDSWARAVRVELQGDTFYVLNPTAVSVDLRSSAIVIRLWSLACHEAAHFFMREHNERFTSIIGSIQADSVESLVQNLSEISRLLA